MRKIITIMILVTVISIITIPAGCFDEETTKEFDFSGFSKVEIGPAFKVTISQSMSYSVSVTTGSNRMKHIEVSMIGDELRIGLEPAALAVSFTTLEASITMPELQGLELTGATSGTIQGFSSSNDFECIVSGASKLSGSIIADDVVFLVSGASTLELTGSGGDMTVNASGASSAKLSGFEIDNADVTLSGASNGTVILNGILDANLSGASRLTVEGNPTMGDINVSSGSSIN